MATSMSINRSVFNHQKDMELYANIRFGEFGTHRRR
jgi:hypothetical protein